MAFDIYPRFFAAFLRNPKSIGAIAPSSQVLARIITEWIDWENADTVIEYGPGTGAFTEEIMARLRPGAKFFAIEVHPGMVADLKRRYPNVVVYQDSVANIKEICEEQGVEEVDAIICGLPWAAFTDEEQTIFLEAMMTVLKPSAQFTTFAYLQGLLLPAGQRFKKKLTEYFSQVGRSRTVWWNLPPAFCYRCRR
ncbi:methyltransferase domain-containing protein [Nitrospinae bacterium AH_259_B05_G02_I21]|nr:methyltransferase domain-containing protein [Nitrospinae bacterium AH_259_B05_G02_I21]MDA2931690.1 methyltransferase domain-containing protein [Nitrospinae bacterium AH-259-F20]